MNFDGDNDNSNNSAMSSPASSSVNNVRLGERLTTQFVQLYRNEKLLWDADHPLYKKRTERLRAYRRIVDGMRIEGFGVPEVANKIKNIRSTYLQELKKIKESVQQQREMRGSMVDDGDEPESQYVPKVVWFPIMNSMFAPIIERQPSPSTTQIISVDDCSDHSYTTLLENSNSTRDVSTRDVSTRDVSTSVKRPPSSDSPPAKKLRNELPSSQEEIQFFSKYIAASLATLPPEYAVRAQKELHDVIYKYKLIEIGQR